VFGWGGGGGGGVGGGVWVGGGLGGLGGFFGFLGGVSPLSKQKEKRHQSSSSIPRTRGGYFPANFDAGVLGVEKGGTCASEDETEGKKVTSTARYRLTAYIGCLRRLKK